jgi:hypothetical protein
METGDRDDDDFRLGWLVNDAVRKANELAPTDIPTQRMPSQRKFLDSLDCRPSFLSELGAEIRALQVVIVNRDPEFATGWQ